MEIDYTEAKKVGDALDYWITPSWCVGSIIPYIERRRTGSWIIIDPGAGTGEVSIAACKSSLMVRFVHGIELHTGRSELCKEAYKKELPNIPSMVTNGDFLSAIAADRLRQWATEFNATTLVIFNPPFSSPRKEIGMEFVEQALKIATPKGIVCALLPLDFCSGVDRAERIHDKFRCSCYPLRRRPSFGASGNSTTGARPVCWLIWDMSNLKATEFRVL
jgi:predicted RNA methylase